MSAESRASSVYNSHKVPPPKIAKVVPSSFVRGHETHERYDGEEEEYHLQITVEAPCLKLQFIMLVNNYHSANDIILECQNYKRYHKLHSMADPTLDLMYRLKKQKPRRMDYSVFISNFNFPPQQTLWLHPKQLPVNINISTPQDSRIVEFFVKPKSSIRGIIKKIKQNEEIHEFIESIEDFDEYALHFVHEGKSVEMEPKRLFLFYKLAEGQLMHLRRRSFRAKSGTATASDIIKKTNDILVSVKCVEKGVSRKYRMKKSSSIAEVLSRFSEQYPARERCSYVVYAKGSSSSSPQRSKPLLSLTRISEHSHDGVCSLELSEEEEEEQQSDYTEQIATFGQFLGTARDASTGGLVPQILVDFRRFLTISNAFLMEGIFRLNGDNQIIERILLEISDPTTYRFGGYHTSWQPHEICSLIKRWFLAMDKRLFAHIPERKLRSIAESPVDVLSLILAELSPMQSSLYSWLVDLLTEACLAYNKTKMDPFNIGLVIAPCLACEENAPMFMHITVTKHTGTIIEKSIIEILQKKSINFQTLNWASYHVNVLAKQTMPFVQGAQLSSARQSSTTMGAARATATYSAPPSYSNRSRGFVVLEMPNLPSDSTDTDTEERMGNTVEAPLPACSNNNVPVANISPAPASPPALKMMSRDDSFSLATFTIEDEESESPPTFAMTPTYSLDDSSLGLSF